MSFGNSIGCELEIPGELEIYKKLFSETGGFIIEVQKKDIANTIDIFKKYKLDVFNLGTTNKTNRIKINNSINKSINVLKTAWENGLREKL